MAPMNRCSSKRRADEPSRSGDGPLRECRRAPRFPRITRVCAFNDHDLGLSAALGHGGIGRAFALTIAVASMDAIRQLAPG
jgi:hypothetical protein